MGDAGGWQRELPREKRDLVLEHFLGKLRDLQVGGAFRPLKELEALSFEASAFANSVDKNGYLLEIANFISRAQEEHAQREAMLTAPSGSTPSGTMPPASLSAPQTKQARARSPGAGAPAGASAFPHPSSPPRAPLSPLERVQICHHTLGVLWRIYPRAQKRIVRGTASNLEYRAYCEATDRQHYLKIVADSLKHIRGKAATQHRARESQLRPAGGQSGRRDRMLRPPMPPAAPATLPAQPAAKQPAQPMRLSPSSTIAGATAPPSPPAVNHRRPWL